MVTSAEKKRGAWAILVVRPGALGDGLRALLSALPPIAEVVLVHDTHITLWTHPEQGPTLFLIDASLAGDELPELLRQIRATWPDTRLVVLTESVQRKAAIETTGADAVFLEGTPATVLFAAIDSLLNSRADSPGISAARGQGSRT